tara:strand:+ start:155 stop:841 length:687 start_codon:yes stop_codon:yes gene_type:complete
MTKFDFKKWVIEHKHGKQSLNEQMDAGNLEVGGMPRAPEELAVCSISDPTLTTCYRFSECIGGQSDGSNLVRLLGSGFQNPDVFYNTMCPGGCIPGDVVEDTNGTKWIYEGTNVDVSMLVTPQASLVGPSTCIMSVMGCMDPGANNFNSSVTNDDGSCAYGYDCDQKGRHPKFGSSCNPNMDPGTNGTYQTLQACIASGCQGIPADTGKTLEPTNKRPQGEPMGPTEY